MSDKETGKGSFKSRLLSLRWNVIQRIARQQARDSLFGWGLYISATGAILVAVLLVYNSVRYTGENGLNIISRPFFLPLQAAATFALLYVTIEATLAIARPREQGSLQVLFFAPIDGSMLVGAYFLAGIAIYAIFVLILVPSLLFLAWLTNFVLPATLMWGLFPTIFTAGYAVAFGLFISAVAPSGRSAVLILVAGILILLVIQGAYAALLNVPPTGRFYDALLFVRVFLRNIQTALLWISPFRMLDVTLSATLRADLGALLQHMGVSLLGTIIWLGASIWALRRRGVLP